MPERLTVRIDPFTLAGRAREIHGFLPISDLRRLGESLGSTEGQVEVDLRFVRDDAGRAIVHGHLQGRLMLVCQRCLAEVPFPVDQRFELALVRDEAEAEALPEEVDAVIVGDARTMHTADLVEDELILALPLVARCPDEAACQPAVELLDAEAIEADEVRQKPFTDLDRDENDH